MPDDRLRYLHKLVSHLAWADERALGALRRATAPVPRALGLYAHVLGAEAVWLARLEGRPSEVAVWPDHGLAACAELAARNAADYRDYLAALRPDDLLRQVHYTNSAGREFDTAVEDILVHVALHGAYHRGQVALLLRDAGEEPAPSDYIELARGGAAARSGPPPFTTGGGEPGPRSGHGR